MKKGTRVTYQYAAGRITKGVIVKQHKAPMADWFVVRLTDEQGTYSGSCHRSQLKEEQA